MIYALLAPAFITALIGLLAQHVVFPPITIALLGRLARALVGLLALGVALACIGLVVLVEALR